MKRALRWFLITAGSLVAAAVLIVATGIALLATDFGRDLVKDQLVSRVNAAISGRVELGALRVGLGHLTLRDAKLLDPEGRAVLDVARVEIRFAIRALLRGHVQLGEVVVERPRARLRQDDGVWNVARALAPRRAEPVRPPAPERGDGEPSTFQIVLRALDVHDGVLDLELPNEGANDGAGPGQAARRVRLESLSAEAAGSYRAEDGAIDAEVELTAVDGTRLRAGAHGHLPDRLRGELRELVVAPPVLRALVPGEALARSAALRATGRVDLRGPRATGALTLWLGRGRVAVRGAFGLRAPSIERVTVDVKELDLAEVLRGAPRTRLNLRMFAAAPDLRPESLQGELRVDGRGGRLAGRALGPLRVRARAADGRVQLDELMVGLPGARLSAHGAAGRDTLDVTGRLELRDLGVTSRALAPGSAPVAGRGSITFALGGAPDAPSLRVQALFDHLRTGDHGVSRLAVSAELPELPGWTGAVASVTAPRVQVGGRQIGPVVLALTARPERVMGLAVRAGPGGATARLDLTGAWSPDRDRLAVARLDVSYGRARWIARQPFRVLVGPRRVGVDGLELVSGEQRVSLDAVKEGRRVHLRGELSRLDLSRVPGLARRAPVAGIADGSVEADGLLPRPKARVQLAIARGRIAGVRQLELALDAHHDRGLVEGRLGLAALGAVLSARFELPARWPLPPRARVNADLEMSPVPLARALHVAGKPAAGALARGTVALRARVRGRAGAPEVRLRADGQGLAFDGQQVGDVAMTVGAAPRAGIEVRVEMRGVNTRGRPARATGPGQGVFRAWTAVELGRLLSSSAEAPRLLANARASLDATLEAVPVGPLLAAVIPGPTGQGTVGLHARLDGRPLGPRGQVRLDARGVQIAGFAATDAALDAELGARATEVKLNLRRRGSDLLVARVRAGASLDALVTATPGAGAPLAHLAQVPLTVRAQVGPLRVQHLDRVTGERVVPRALRGRLSASLRIDGTLGAPRVAARVDADDLAVDDVSIGAATVAAHYQNARASAVLNVVSDAGGQRGQGAGGRLRVSLDAPIDLSYPSLSRAPSLAALPLDGHLEARGFDLAALSGVVEPVRAIGGRLEGELRVAGRTSAPRASGRLEWKEGTLALTGQGRYRNIHLLLEGDQSTVHLRDLSVSSGGGRAHVVGELVRAAAGVAVRSRMKLDRFPVYSDGQVAALLTASASVRGTMGPDGVRVDPLAIEEAHVKLPDKSPRRLQDLSRPKDIVLVRHGTPVDAAQARRLAELRRRRAALLAEDERPVVVTRPRPQNGEPSVRAKISGPRNIWLRGKDVNLEVGLGDDFRVLVVDGEPRVVGTVQIRRGRVEVFGRRFDVQDTSVVRFTGPPSAPVLDVRARYRNERENVTVAVSLKGQPGSPEGLALSLTSEPAHSETEILTLLVSGRLTMDRRGGGSSVSNQAVSVIGGVIASALQKTLARRLPVDVLTIETGGHLGTSRIEAGTYVTDDLYLAYVGRVGADPTRLQNRNAVHLEYQLTRRWSFQGEYGDARTGFADLVWTRSY